MIKAGSKKEREEADERKTALVWRLRPLCSLPDSGKLIERGARCSKDTRKEKGLAEFFVLLVASFALLYFPFALILQTTAASRSL
jgi:hypothetical protein